RLQGDWSSDVCSSDLLLVHLYKEYEVIRKMREGGHKGPVVGWFWDNHHHVFDNFRATADLDVIVPGHAFAGNYLRSRRCIMADRSEEHTSELQSPCNL